MSLKNDPQIFTTKTQIFNQESKSNFGLILRGQLITVTVIQWLLPVTGERKEISSDFGDLLKLLETLVIWVLQTLTFSLS